VPVSLGASADAAYVVVSSPDSLFGQGALSPIVVTGLTNGRAYTFTVFARTSLGDGSPSLSSASVVPLGVPGPPIAVEASVVGDDVFVSFLPPVSDGGLPVFEYTITSTPAGVGTTVNGTTLNTILSRYTFPYGVGVRFSVVARNARGTGILSVPSAMVQLAPSRPNPPRSIVATGGDQSVTLSWLAPAYTYLGTPISLYILTQIPGGSVYNSTSSPLVIDGLSNGDKYTFVLQSVDGNGNGVKSEVSTPVSAIATGPSVPVTGVTLEAGDSQFRVSFVPPTSTNGFTILYYIVTATASQEITVTTTSVASPVTLVNVKNNIAYSITVVARTALADSLVSAPVLGIAHIPRPSFEFADAASKIVVREGETSFVDVVFSDADPVRTFTPLSVPDQSGDAGFHRHFAVQSFSSDSSAMLRRDVSPTTLPAARTLQALNRDVTIVYEILDGTSRNGADFLAQNGTLTWLKGDTTSRKRISFTTVADQFSEDEESFSVRLVSVTSGDFYPVLHPLVQVFIRANGAAGTPAAPTIRSVLTSDGSSLLVYFDRDPKSSIPVTTFVVTGAPGDISIVGTTSPIRVAGLESGRMYTLQVRGFNSIGDGDLSEPSEPVDSGRAQMQMQLSFPYATVTANSTYTSKFRASFASDIASSLNLPVSAVTVAFIASVDATSTAWNSTLVTFYVSTNHSLSDSSTLPLLFDPAEYNSPDEVISALLVQSVDASSSLRQGVVTGVAGGVSIRQQCSSGAYATECNPKEPGPQLLWLLFLLLPVVVAAAWFAWRAARRYLARRSQRNEFARLEKRKKKEMRFAQDGIDAFDSDDDDGADGASAFKRALHASVMQLREHRAELAASNPTPLQAAADAVGRAKSAASLSGGLASCDGKSYVQLQKERERLEQEMSKNVAAMRRCGDATTRRVAG
jgi:hypothetical protein